MSMSAVAGRRLRALAYGLGGLELGGILGDVALELPVRSALEVVDNHRRGRGAAHDAVAAIRPRGEGVGAVVGRLRGIEGVPGRGPWGGVVGREEGVVEVELDLGDVYVGRGGDVLDAGLEGVVGDSADAGLWRRLVHGEGYALGGTQARVVGRGDGQGVGTLGRPIPRGGVGLARLRGDEVAVHEEPHGELTVVGRGCP